MVSYSTFEPTTKIPFRESNNAIKIHKRFGLYKRYLPVAQKDYRKIEIMNNINPIQYGLFKNTAVWGRLCPPPP